MYCIVKYDIYIYIYIHIHTNQVEQKDAVSTKQKKKLFS